MVYDGSHSITFGNKHTFNDWKLMPTSRPLFNPPPPKTKYTDLPGGNGSIDLSDSLTGYPVFENRTGTLEFIVLNGYRNWSNRYMEIMEYLHGRKMRAVLDDDPAFFYEGRFTVSEWESNNDGTWSVIKIDYNVNPYKWSLAGTSEPWLWDPFNFETGVILPGLFGNIDIPSSSTYTDVIMPAAAIGSAPFSPSLVINADNNAGMDVKFVNPNLGINIPAKHYANGSHVTYDYVVYGSDCVFSFKGKGKVSIDFKLGRL